MTKEGKQEQKAEKELQAKKDAFLGEYLKLADSHGFDFSIFYDFDRQRGVFARFEIIEKPKNENETPEETPEAKD